MTLSEILNSKAAHKVMESVEGVVVSEWLQPIHYLTAPSRKFHRRIRDKAMNSKYAL